MYRAHGTGPYAGQARSSQPWRLREVEIPINLSQTNASIEADGALACEGSDPQVVYTLAAPEYVDGVRLEYQLTTPDMTPAELQVFWSLTGSFGFAEHRSQTLSVPSTDQRHESTFWIHDTLDALRVDPARGPCTFRLLRARFLLRDDTDARRPGGDTE
ncbi:MAG: hypothetical protein ACYTFT_12480 [Planctomycetota bacterium]|jgi:hypothetical protein